MEKKKNNPVEGRLSIPSPTGTGPHAKFTKRNTNYGVERLGITSDAEPKTEEPVWELSEKPKPPAPHTVVVEPITILPASKEVPRQAESPEAMGTKHRYSISSKLSEYKSILGRRKIKTILLFAGIPVIVLTLLLWLCIGGEETVPQSASATHVTKVASKTEPKMNPASPTAEKMRQHPESGRAISAATPARSTLREIFNLLAETKPAPETTAAVPAQAAPPPKPDKPQDADPEPVVKKVPIIAVAPAWLGFKLSGIMRGPKGRTAFINNRPVRVGQTINDAKVVHIGDFSVEVELKGRRYLVGISSPPSERAPVEVEVEDENKSSDSDDDKAKSKTKDEEK